MIIFYAADFELDLTDTQISLVDENNLFFDYFVKGYSLPFMKYLNKSVPNDLLFLDMTTTRINKKKYIGRLLVDSDFFEAYLILNKISGQFLEGTVYYGSTTLSVYDKKLSALPFPVITPTNMASHAASIISKGYPEVGYNFPMIIDEKYNERTDFDWFEGYINQFTSAFVPNTTEVIEGATVIKNKNVLTPFPYLAEILRVGFASEGLTVVGNLFDDVLFSKLILDSSKEIIEYSALSEETKKLELYDTYIDSGITISHYRVSKLISLVGTHKIAVNLNLPSFIEVVSFEVKFQSTILFSGNTNVINQEFSQNIETGDPSGYFYVDLKLKEAVEDLDNYNVVEYKFQNSKLVRFPKSISISQVVPDITFGAFVNKLKNWLNLEITIDKQFVRLDFIDQKLDELLFVDKTAFEIPEPEIEINTTDLYKLMYTANEYLHIDKAGVNYASETINDGEVQEINMGLTVLPVEELNGIFTAKRNEGDDKFKILLYDGLQGGKPLAIQTFAGLGFKLTEVYDRYWKKWLNFRLNSKTITDKFVLHQHDAYNVTTGIYKYNQKQILKRVSKRRISENWWEVSTEAETIN